MSIPKATCQPVDMRSLGRYSLCVCVWGGGGGGGGGDYGVVVHVS